MLIMVEQQPPGPLQSKTHRAVRSRRGRLDKPPWRSLSDQVGTVEQIFIYHVLLGEHCLPFRMMTPAEAVIPFDGTRLLSGEDERLDRYPGIADWWRAAERTWNDNRSSEKRTLNQQIDYIGQLSAQFPLMPTRVVYTKAGNYLTAATVTDTQAVIDHTLYWGAMASVEEARYLTAVLNAPALGAIVEPYQSRGAFGPRHFDKYVWYPPVPEFDASDEQHRRLANLGAEGETVAATVPLPDGGLGRAPTLAVASPGPFDLTVADSFTTLTGRMAAIVGYRQ